jgi:cyclic pyranopterin phosphate synthase
MELSHLDQQGRPAMVDVGGKAVTQRTATAEAQMLFPAGCLDQIDDQTGGRGLQSAKGPIDQTAVLAGMMAAKRTPELIPLCHTIPLEKCAVEIERTSADRLTIRCSVRATHKTGVEMEALTGVSVAALTVYDMCKALTHEIVIESIRLIEKRGGKRDVG